MNPRLWPVLAAISRGFNVATGGNPGETFCCRVGRNVLRGTNPIAFWAFLGRFLDWAFQSAEPQHCLLSYLRELAEQGGSSELPGRPIRLVMSSSTLADWKAGYVAVLLHE